MTYFGALKGLTRHDARHRSLAWLERVELGHVASWRVDRLSKGMSQKVQIASVLLTDPEICVMDEPTTGLDPVNVRVVHELLLERRSHGRTTILSTHHMNQVEALCDRVALINRGRLVVYGSVSDVRRRHSLPEIRVRARAPLPTVPEVASAVQDGDDTWRVMLAAGAPPADVLTSLVRAGAVIDRFEPMLAPMEDIFLQVVGQGDRA
jgi:ABC-2 type transport system ATP-binding protein